MCGLAGYVQYGGHSIISINQMLNAIKHRGPDATGVRVFDLEETQVGLGHQRLSIIDLNSNANQPLSDQTDRYHIVYNGEVYNFNDIRKQLDSTYTFKTVSDTEVILYSFIEWGKECVEKFTGMFSIVIFDKLDLKITFFNDRLGVKPLYYYLNDEMLIFGSELKALMTYEGFDKSINHTAVTQFMQYGYIQPPLSIFTQVSKIVPGTIIEYDINKRTMLQTKYWDILDMPKTSNVAGVNPSELHKRIKSACQLRNISDVTICSFLSAGLDSSLVTALAAEDGPIHSVTLGVRDTRYDESDTARQISQSIGSIHDETYIEEKDIKTIIMKVNDYFDEPFSDTSMYPTYLLSKFASKNFKVALSSDGGDEAFCGYNRYLFFNRFSWIYRLPMPVKVLAKSVCHYFSQKDTYFRNRIPSLSLKFTKFGNVLSAKSEADVYRLLNTYINDDRVSEILHHTSIESGYYKELDDLIEKSKGNKLQAAMLIDYKTYVYQLLTKIDRASMANSLEVREPLLDHNLIEFCAKLSLKDKLSGNVTKIALKNILENYLPAKLISKNKKGFSIPIDNWLNNELRELVDDLTCYDEIQRSGVFKFDEVTKIKTKFYDSGVNYIELWHIVIFQLWYRKWC